MQNNYGKQRKYLLKKDRCQLFAYLPFLKRQILDFSKQKEFADNSYKFDENGRKFSNRVENTVGKGEFACYKR